LPFLSGGVAGAVDRLVREKAVIRGVTMAEAKLTDGQSLLAFNDLFLGPRSHVSARYRIVWSGKEEPQSSSGVLVSTGAGSTGWLSSIFNMARGVAGFSGGTMKDAMRLEWEDRRLLFVVREPFLSRHSQARIVAGMIEANQKLVMESLMPSGGVIF